MQKIYRSKEIFELTKLAKENDQKAFSELYRRYCSFINNVISKYIKNENDKEEVIQDAFIKAFTSLDLYKLDNGFGYWLKSIAKNKAIDFLRKKSRSNAESSDIFEDGDIENIYSNNETPLSKIISECNINSLETAISQMKWKDRELFKLRFIDELSYESVAKELNVTIGTVKSRIFDMRQRLKNKIK